jgi:hypothetical protein
MPPVSERQRKFMGAELGRKRAGQKTQTGMSEAQLREYASKPSGRRLPAKKKGNPGPPEALRRGYRQLSTHPMNQERRD